MNDGASNPSGRLPGETAGRRALEDAVGCLMSPVGFVVILGVIALMPFTWMMDRVASRLKWRRLDRKGRACVWSKLERSLPAGGTLLIDELTLGWNRVNVWWTPDDVRAIAAAEGLSPTTFDDAMQDPTGDRLTPWCTGRYFSEESGTALLVEQTHSFRDRAPRERRIQAIQARYPRVQRIDLWSGIHYCDARAKQR
jgi:hypothetical protein